MLQINQVLDAWFNKGFKGQKCKTLLKMASSRIKLLRNKREIHLKQLRREVAQLLHNGQESTAQIRVEHIIREQNILEAYDTLELFSELLIVRMPIMELQRECPLDLKEAVATLIFAAPRASDLPELAEVQKMLSFKYGSEFAVSATELRPDCGVNRKIIEKLSARAPSPAIKLNVLKEVAKEHNIEWDSASTEHELWKAREDLLEGPNNSIGPIQMSPIPCFKDDGYAVSSAASWHQESLFPSSGKLSSPSTEQIDEPKFVPTPLPKADAETLPGRFYSPPRESSITQQSDLLEETLLQRSLSRTKSEGSMNLQDIIEAAEAAAESAEKAARAARAAAELARSRISPRSMKNILPEEMPQDTSETDTNAPTTFTGVHVMADCYDWTQENNQREGQANETSHLSQGDVSAYLAPGGYDWSQQAYAGSKEEQLHENTGLQNVMHDSYDWTSAYMGGKRQDNERKGHPDQDRGSPFNDYGDTDEPSHHTLPLTGQVSMKEAGKFVSTLSMEVEDHSGHQYFYDEPKFDIADPKPFQRQPSLEEDPYYTYPNLFSK